MNRGSTTYGCYFLLFTFYFLLVSCAQIVTPTGGPRDSYPPRVVKYIPDSAATNFSSKNIAIIFNEYIQLSDLQKQFVVSPPMTILPEVKLKGKSLLIELKDSLRKNTTYALNFGDAIRDLRENNPIRNFQYIFSTGSYIDTLSISGIVKNAFDLKPEKGVFVMLYEDITDSVPYKKIPSYFAKTQDNGAYKITNIRPGTYKIFALKDANVNYLYDSPEESIGFSSSSVKIAKNTSCGLLLFNEEPQKQKLKKAYVAGHGHLVFAFSKPINDSLQLRFLSAEPKQSVFIEYSTNRDTLHYWFAEDFQDSIKLEVALGKKVLERVYLKPITLGQRTVSGRGESWGLKVIPNVTKDKRFDFYKSINLRFNHPVPYSGIHPHYTLVSSLKKEPACVDTTQPDHIPARYSFIKTWGLSCSLSSDSAYYLFIAPGSFTDLFGLTNDTVKVDFKTQEEKYYGTLKLNFKAGKSKYILQLLDEKGNLVKQDFVTEGKILNYTYLTPGIYKLKIIYDQNADNKWSPGNYLQKIQPEKVIYCPNPITIRSNWDSELDWKVE